MSTSCANLSLLDNKVSEPAHGISEWPDTDDIYARLAALVKNPMRPIRRENMETVLKYFQEKCIQSRRLSEQAERVIPGGIQHNLAFNYPFPLAMASAHGAYLTDVDGNHYIDFLKAGGPTLLGANDEYVRHQIHALLDSCGPTTGLLHEYEVKLAELVCEAMPAVEMFRMLGSGTEAVMAALRLARAYTGRNWVVKIGGAYHGWFDQMVYGMRIPGTGRREAVGIPRPSTAYIQERFPNDLEALRRTLWLNRLRGGTAAIIVEPLGPESGTRPVRRDFNCQLRELCNEFGTLLIFDEVVSGFRVGMGGAQGYFGVKPDITVLGKCLTGGYPMAGGIGGRRDVMMLLAGGIGTTSKRVFVGGTLSANPLSCAAGYFALQEMRRTEAASKAGRAGDRLRKGLSEIIDRLQLPYVTYNLGSIVHLHTSGVMHLSMRNPLKVMREAEPRKHMMEEMGAAFSAYGVITLAGSRMYTGLADTDEVIDDALNRFEDVLKLV
jgi:glutamate-1-semialdehyde 2,1-aminomutase